MADPIEAHYTPDGDGWTVAVKGRGRTLTGRAPGLVAARDKADQLAEQIAPEESGHKTVVHMMNGDAVEFTTAYLTARLARTEEPPAESTPADEETEDSRSEAPDNASATADPADETDEARPTAESEPAGAEAPTGGVPTPAEPVSGETEVPAPAASVEGEQVAAKPTPAPRTEAQTAHPAAPPAEGPTPATRESRVQT